MAKRRHSDTGDHFIQRASKKVRTADADDHLSDLSDELLIRILHLLPIDTLLQCQRLSHRFYTLAGDSQVWKYLYYNRFVLPRALRIPGIKTAQPEHALHFSSRRSKWLEDESLVNRVDGKKTNWKAQYKLRYNWSIGACEVQEIHVADQPSVPSMLVSLAERVVVTADKEGLRAWDLKEKTLIAEHTLGGDTAPTCLAVDEQDSLKPLAVAIGFMDGSFGTWRLDITKRIFVEFYRHPPSSNGRLSAIAFAAPYILTITAAQLLSLYTFAPRPTPEVDKENLQKEFPKKYTDLLVLEDDPLEPPPEVQDDEEDEEEYFNSKTSNPPSSAPKPHLLASLQSHTSWPPVSLSIRTTSTTLIASIAYSLPTYLSGYTIGLQELHLSLETSTITLSRLASALAQGYSSLSLSSPSSGTSSPVPTSSPSTPRTSDVPPTSLSYSHPYILATHPDNTLTLYLCTSTSTSLTLSPGTKLWGHTSSVSSAEITPRGKAVSVSTRGNELRVWELEGFSSLRKNLGTKSRTAGKSVRVTSEEETELGAHKRWVGFDDEVVIVLKESRAGGQALMVYDFT